MWTIGICLVSVLALVAGVTMDASGGAPVAAVLRALRMG
jgi:hypothetical protein